MSRILVPGTMRGTRSVTRPQSRNPRTDNQLIKCFSFGPLTAIAFLAGVDHDGGGDQSATVQIVLGPSVHRLLLTVDTTDETVGGPIVNGIEARTLGEQIYQALEAAIVDDELPPGTELPEVELAEQYGTSRGPVREALLHLSSDGLVVLRPRRGAVVRVLSRKEFLDAYQVREVLEVLAVSLTVPTLTPEQLDILDGLMETMDTAVFRDDIDMFFEANAEFHKFFVDQSGNVRLQQLHLQLSRPMARYRRRSLALRGDLRSSYEEHKRIMAAVHARDPDLAANLTQLHIAVPQQRLAGLNDDEWDLIQTTTLPGVD